MWIREVAIPDLQAWAKPYTVVVDWADDCRQQQRQRNVQRARRGKRKGWRRYG